MTSIVSRSAAAFLCGVALFGGSAAARGQDLGGGEKADPAELMRQIRRNLSKIEDELQKVRGGTSGEASDAARKDVDKLVETLKRRQEQVTKDIDEIVRQMKASGGGGGGGGGGKSSSSSSSKGGKNSGGKSKDRNASEGGEQASDDEGENSPKNSDGKEKKDGSSGEPKGGKDKSESAGGGGAENPEAKGGKPEQREGSDPNPPKAKKVVHVQINDIWGRLPKETRQKLVDRNFQDFTPEYEEEVKEYLRRTNIVDK